MMTGLLMVTVSYSNQLMRTQGSTVDMFIKGNVYNCDFVFYNLFVMNYFGTV